MDEPFILSLIKGEANSLRDAISSTLIIPSRLSQIRIASLKSARIEHVPGTLQYFVESIEKNLGKRYSPTNIIARETDIEASLLNKFGQKDISALQGLFKLDREYLSKLSLRSQSQKSKERMSFFQGYGPSWGVVADKAIAEFDQFKILDQNISNSIKTNKVTVLTGEAGSGKSTYNFRFCRNVVANSDLQIFQ